MFRQDLRHAVRGLIKDGKLTAIVIACLALGIGLNVTQFAVVDGVLIQPLPFAAPERLVALNSTLERGGIRRGSVSYLDLNDWRDLSASFTAVAGASFRSLAISDGRSEPERFAGAAVSWDLFPTLGVAPALGRPFGPQDDRPGAEPVVILSDAVWQRRYLGDPSIVGGRILVNARPHTVVGVMPPGFAFPTNERVWVPLAPLAASDARNARGLLVVARLRDGVEIGAARSELAAIAGQLATRHPTTNDGWSATARPLRDDFVPADVSLVLLTMMGAVTMVLLTACANVANLMLARATGRQREFSVRAALGAGRMRLVRQLLTECLVLATAAAPLGLLVAYGGVAWLRNAMPVDMVPYTVQWQIDARSMLYTVAVALLTGVVFGLAPAIQAGRVNLVDSLRDGSRGSGTSGRRARLRNALVTVEVALALVLLVGAALFVRSFVNLRGASVGFDPAPILGLRFFMAGDGYADEQSRINRVEDIVRRVEAVPGVESAFASNFLPLQAGGGGAQVIVDGRPVAAGEEPRILFVATTPHLHRTLGMPMRRGRDFTDAEGMTRSAVAVIDDTMADRLWPGQDPVGRRFRIVGGEPPDTFTVIGVAPAIGRDNPDDDRPPMPAAFVAYPYAPTPNTALTVRTAADPTSTAGAVRETLRASDPNLPVFLLRTMNEFNRLSFWQYRIFGIMFGVFGAVALILAAIGVYGVLSFAVSQRTQEIGLRMALGAARSDVQRMVVHQGLVLAGLGIALGLLGAFGVTRVVGTLLYNVTPTDPLSFGGVAVFLALIAWAASYFPARRATAVDPNVALRME
jgi:putative ABC transport system permease protein